MSDKKKVMWMTDDPWQASGYGMMTRHVLRRLAKDFDVHCVALQHGGGVIEFEGYKVYPRMYNNDGFDILEPYAEMIKPDVIVTVKDIGLQEGYVDTVLRLKKKYPNLKWYPYCPVDTDFISYGWDRVFSNCSKIVAMSEWTKKIIKEKSGFDSVAIPGGVDLNIFKPIPKEEMIEKYGANPWWGAFVVGAVGRNQQRKMWNQLIKGFAAFAKDKNDVALLLHVDTKPVLGYDGWLIGFIAKKYGVENKVFPTNAQLDVYTRFWIDDVKMNEIYNMMDVFCFPTGGEGFGMPLLEAQAAGKPVVTTDFTTGQELVSGHGILVPVLKDKYDRDVFFEGQNGVEFKFPDDKEITKALQKLYDDRKLLKEWGEASREHALKYDWEKITAMWADLFNNG